MINKYGVEEWNELKLSSGFVADSLERFQNMPVNGSYFDYPTCFVFDNIKFEEEKKDEKNS